MNMRDWLMFVFLQDAQKLASKLPNVVDFYVVPYKHFTHLDFCYADDVGTLVYHRLITNLKRFD